MYFALDAVKFDRERQDVEIPFAANGKDADPQSGKLPLGILKVNAVTDLRIDDTERVGCYNIAALEYDELNGWITIVTGIPLTMRLAVARCDVEVLNPT